MPGERKTKIIGKRIDLSYHRQPSPMRTLRRLMVIVCGLAAALWGGWALFARSERIYNPGPVAAVHAMFENNCATCHDGGGDSGKFLKTVSDAACLNCHNGSIHSEKQISLASLTNGKPAMSSNCTTCHVEHKGHEAMAGTSDLLCTRCHDNLNSNVAGGKTDLRASVKYFDSAVKTLDSAPGHPPFGRALRQGGQGPDATLVDPTPLKFNHKKHLAEINPTVGDCATCHHVSTSGDRRIMQPVSYDANCKSCHPLSLAPGLPEVPHEPMEIVRLYTAGVPSLFAQRLAMMTPEEKEKALTITTEKKVGLRTVKETKRVTEAEWLEAQAKDLVEKKVAASAVANMPEYKALESLDPTTKNAAALELYTAFGMTTSCTYCHTVTGAPPAVAKSAADLLHTLPTGYHPPKNSPTTAPATRPTATPEGRRWFTASVFDHDSHRSMTCVDCHGQVMTSTLTSDVLLPQIQTCTACHHNGGRDQMAATNNCVSCHIYHDRDKQADPVKGRGIDQLLGKGKSLASK